MALLFMDGFCDDSIQYKWDTSSYGYTTSGADPRLPGGRYITNAALADYYKSIPATSQLFVGFGMYAASGYAVSFYGDSGATQHITVARNTSRGILEIRRGSSGGTLLATGTTTIPRNTWCYVEVSVTISDTVGEVHVRLNGGSTDEASFTGDTKNGGTATTIDRFGVNLVGRLSDVYILDTSGTFNNTFLGDVAVRNLVPSGNGASSQLTGSDGDKVDNYEWVDEMPFNALGYAGSATPGDLDTYAITDLGAGITTVYGVQINSRMAKTEASLAQAKLALRSGGTVYYGTTRALSTSYVGYYQLYETDPATSAQWTTGGVNAIEAGMEVV